MLQLLVKPVEEKDYSNVLQHSQQDLWGSSPFLALAISRQ